MDRRINCLEHIVLNPVAHVQDLGIGRCRAFAFNRRSRLPLVPCACAIHQREEQVCCVRFEVLPIEEQAHDSIDFRLGHRSVLESEILLRRWGNRAACPICRCQAAIERVVIEGDDDDGQQLMHALTVANFGMLYSPQEQDRC